MTDPIVEKLRQYSSATPSKWREEAQWRIDNKKKPIYNLFNLASKQRYGKIP
ncbi:MAG: hypothetical protein LIP09_08530 [Bacteroidales bacterium]|nr:hypothetical protein [Bacteroidales bacterium]